MKNKEKFYITTPIYYISGDPHIGHLYTTVAADIISRFKKMCGFDVLFSTGSDENSLKILKAAKKVGLLPKEFVDKEADRWMNSFKNYGVEFSRFIRTTDEDHIETVRYVLQTLYDKGYIYKGKYEGWYCIDCETFWSEGEIKENICPECGREVIWVSEENYFFKLSAFRNSLISFYEENQKAIEPVSRYNEVLSTLKAELKDISISRSSVNWGIRLPFDESQVTYVWIDALINYLTVPKYIKNRENFAKFWPPNLQLMSKDIIRFHCIIWPALLLSLDLPLPKKIFVHGWWLTSGEKMSKSKGNVVDPYKIVENLSSEVGIERKIAVDALRLFMFREAKFGEDAVFTEERFYARYNFDLANDLGNLINRVYSMTDKYFGGVVPCKHLYSDEFGEKLNESIEKYKSFMEKYNLKETLESIWSFVRYSNKLIEDSKPWEMLKNSEMEKLSSFIYSLLDGIRVIALMLYPFMPYFAKEVLSSLGIRENNIDSLSFGELVQSSAITKLDILFPKVKMYKGTEIKAELEENLIDTDYFSKIDLRIGEIIEAKRIEKSEKLVLLKVKGKNEQVKQIVAGIGKFYSPELLIGKKVVYINNLKPIKLMGFESEGMVLAASEKEKLSLITTDAYIEDGARVK
jgi:methionyl-tRNA synthetase